MTNTLPFVNQPEAVLAPDGKRVNYWRCAVCGWMFMFRQQALASDGDALHTVQHAFEHHPCEATEQPLRMGTVA